MLNKIDLVSESDRVSNTSWLETQFPKAKVVYSQYAQLPPEILLQSFEDRTQIQQFGSHHTDLFTTLTFEQSRSVDVDELVARLKEDSMGLARAKGFVESDTGDLMVIQLVGRRVSVSYAPVGVPHHLVVIGQSGKFNDKAICDLLVDQNGFRQMDDSSMAH